jgi:UPF0716 family protein affecting phage T7 exclusion
MKLIKWAVVALLGLPALELLAFLIIAALIGWLWAMLLVVASSLVGIRLLRKFGRQDVARMRDGLAADGLRAIHLEDPAVARTAGALLLALPGFITDACGLALFIPALRRRIAAALITLARTRPVRSQDQIIDLSPAEWKEEQSEQLSSDNDRR